MVFIRSASEKCQFYLGCDSAPQKNDSGHIMLKTLVLKVSYLNLANKFFRHVTLSSHAFWCISSVMGINAHLFPFV